MRFVSFVLAMLLISFWAEASHAEPPSDKLIAALIHVESGGNDDALGDKHLKHKAYGPLQIRQPVCDDINRRYGTSYQAQDCLGNRALSVKICKIYIDMYATEKRVGRTPTNEDKARMWNGGPNGHVKASTESYWNKVQMVLKE